jgi:hypothetical protein
MKALTICQPYAHMIAIGVKGIENRTWWTAYRGLLAMHAGKSKKMIEASDLAQWPEMSFGSIVAVASLGCCIRVEHLNPGLPHAEGPWCWLLEGVRRLERAIPCTGHLGLWNLPADVAAKVIGG